MREIIGVSEMVEDYIAEYPAVYSMDAIAVIGIIMPHLRRAVNDLPECGYSAYRYSATIRELTRD